MIEARELTKRFGERTAVDHVSFTVQPGVVTGFLGPNGAGKSTTMRLILGLDRPSGGSVTVAGRPYDRLVAPVREVGALLDAKAIDGTRTARAHLSWLARAGGIGRRRVGEVLDLVGLSDVADRRAGGFSLGMSQRLGIAAALLGDPPVLLLDEPVNGLDPEGIHWARTLLRDLAAEGRAVLVSSHLMSEMETTADHVLVIGRGRLLADTSMAEFRQMGSGTHVRVVSPDAGRLRELLERAGATLSRDADGALRVVGVDNVRVGELAARLGLRIHELTPQRASLEATFMELTHDSVEYRAEVGTRPAATIGASR
jgi:ABC-2 type transport system ATP-binding protein